MFDQSIKRIGFACKYKHDDPNLPARITKEEEDTFKFRGLTHKHLSTNRSAYAGDLLLEVAEFNIGSLSRMLQYVSLLPAQRRMFRIGSDIIPLYTHEAYKNTWQRTDYQQVLADKLAPIGEFARKHDIRLSFHPGQFTVLGSDRQSVVENSIAEFEYHVDVIRMMGYGQKFQDFKCNVHIAGKLGADGMRDTVKKLSDEARRVITIENPEFAWGLNDTLKLADIAPIVFDIHHYWIESEGKLFQRRDPRWQQIVDSWQGVRPVMHYSAPRIHGVFKDRLPVPVNHTKLPDFKDLRDNYHFNKSNLRQHSDTYENEPLNDCVLDFWQDADIMCEAKWKNRASKLLFEYAQNNGF